MQQFILKSVIEAEGNLLWKYIRCAWNQKRRKAEIREKYKSAKAEENKNEGGDYLSIHISWRPHFEASKKWQEYYQDLMAQSGAYAGVKKSI